MKDQESNDNWQLEEGSQVDDRWVLRESEQQFADQWELNQSTEDDPIQDWQPVEYNRPERSGFSWVLPVLITVFLLALIGYSGFILLPQIIGPNDRDSIVATGETPTPETENEGSEPADPEEPDSPTAPEPPDESEPTPEPPDMTEPEAPTPEPVQPSPTEEEPTPQPAIIEQDFATVITTYGVNSRSEPATNAPVVRILNQGESFLLFGSPAEGWLELLVTEEDAELVQGEPIQGEVAYAASEFFDIEPQPIMRVFYEEIMAFAGREPEEPVVIAPDPTDDTEPPDEEAPALPPQQVFARVDSVAGLNVRSEPSTISDILGLINEGDTALALALSDDEEWVQVRLEDGVTGWLFAEFVTVLGDLSRADSTPPSPADAPGVIDTTQVITSGVAPPAPYSSMIPGDSPAVVVAVPDGAIARLQPNPTAEELTLLPHGAALAAIARSADGQWIEVEMPEGNLTVWVSRAVVSVTEDIDTLPMEGETATDTSDGPVLMPTATPAANATPPAPSDTETVAEATVRDILLSVYPEPNSEGNPIALLPRGTRVPVTGRNESSDWILVETEDGDTGWVSVRSVLLNTPVESLPVAET